MFSGVRLVLLMAVYGMALHVGVFMCSVCFHHFLYFFHSLRRAKSDVTVLREAMARLKVQLK